MTKYRLKYCKESGMRFVSHLDLLKIFSRAARRCKLPLSYSQGFNPHPELVFNSPLPLGVTSESEFVDISLDEELLPEHCMELLASTLPQGIRPVSVRKLSPGEATVMKHVCSCEYCLMVQIDGISPASYIEGIRSLLESNKAILVMKKSKSGVKETDIRPMIYNFFENAIIQESRIFFHCTVSAGNVVNLRPEVAVNGLTEHIFGTQCRAQILSVHKVRYYTEDGGSPD